MRITRATLPACIVAVVCIFSVVPAQQPPSPPAGTAAIAQDAASILRGKDVLSQQDKDQLRQWIVDQVNDLARAAKENDLKSMTQPRRNMTDAAVSGSAPATVGFRTAYAELGAGVFQPYLSVPEDAKGNDPRVALSLTQILVLLKQPGTIDVLLAGLKGRHPAVRLCAARAIRDMRADIVATRANQLPRIIADIQQVAAKESDPPTARILYEAIDFRAQAPTTSSQVIAALLDILKVRSQLYGNDLVSDFYPDTYALNLLQGVDLPDPLKRTAIQIASDIIAGASSRWASLAPGEDGETVEEENPYDVASVRDWHLRYQLASVTLEAESLLKKLGAAAPGSTPSPEVASLMASLATVDRVRAAADKWSSLVQAKAPATATAPATPAP